MGSHSRNKKRDEQAIFDAFARVCPAVPSGEIDSEHEHPDILLITATGHALGIELTELLMSHPDAGRRRAKIGYAIRTLNRAQYEYFKRENSPIRAVIEVDESADLDRCDIEPLSEWLVAFVADAARLDWTGSVFIENLYDEMGSLPKAFKYMWLERAEGPVEWGRSGGGGFEPMTPDHINGVLAVKDVKSDRYRLRCGELWLVIYYDTDEPTWFEVPDSLYEYTYTTSFDRVFLFNWFRQQAVELRVARP